jgi:phosphomannomutase
MTQNKMTQIKISELMAKSGVAFGTSGARGLVSDMTDAVCFAYAQAFLQYLNATNQWAAGGAVVIGGDLRSSTPRMMRACAAACVQMGARVVYAGLTASPAVALYGFTHGMPSMMVTGSHIPDDRNGVKFNTPTGEILKSDELGMAAQTVGLADDWFDDACQLRLEYDLPAVNAAVAQEYVARYTQTFGADLLKGVRVGVYQHSSVGRDLMLTILAALGADALPLGRAETFIPVDTEAIRYEDVVLAQQWAANGDFDALVSTDGDADRPLVSDERGRWLRGDVLGVLCARFLGCADLATPVSSNTVVEKSHWFDSVTRTKIGSPYVIGAMNDLLAQGKTAVAGYEANGGFLLASSVDCAGQTLAALPTRDALIVMIAVLALSRAQALPVSELAAALPARFTVSDRIKAFPTELGLRKIAALSPKAGADCSGLTQMFGGIAGAVAHVSEVDGLRMTFENDEVIHLRPSGNAPELRCYTEAATMARAQEINAATMRLLAGWRHVD